jgi:hypothetical protein
MLSGSQRLQRAACCDVEVMALWRHPRGAAPAPFPVPALAGGATCYAHPDNAAVGPCATCGRFMCALCDIALDGGHCCPTCFDQLQAARQSSSLRQKDVLYDSMALATGWLWIIVYPSIIVALPAVAYWTIAKWRAPENYLIPRRRWRFFAAWVGIFSIPLLIVALFLIPARLR